MERKKEEFTVTSKVTIDRGGPTRLHTHCYHVFYREKAIPEIAALNYMLTNVQ